MQIRSYAKINWALRITGKRDDGYHDLETLFQTISLHDVLTFRKSEHMKLRCDDRAVPLDDTNLILRAARALEAPPMEIDLQKRIPAGGGLGGGSSNAAATLRAVDDMLALKTPPRRLHEMALHLGSDVPFFLVGGTAYATGRGEQITPLPSAAPIPLLLLFPQERVSTREAFARIRAYSKPVGIETFRAAVSSDLLAHADLLVNDFEEPIFEVHPHMREIKNRLLCTGAAWAGMTGSGSTIVGAFRSQALRDAACADFGDVDHASAETIGPPPI